MSSTRVCLNDLENLSSETSSEKRRELLRRVTDLFFATEGQQNAGDATVFGSVMERVAYELEAEARTELAERLCASDAAPHNIVCRLAEDEIEVAQPMLERSKVLTDDDLVRIAAFKGQDHLFAISGRDELASVVTDVIVENGDDRVLKRVSGNDGARFSPAGMSKLVTHATSNEGIRSRLLKRRDMTEEQFDEIKAEVADKLKAELAAIHPDITAEDIDKVIDAKAARARMDKLDFDIRDMAYPKADIEKLYKAGELNEIHVIRYAREERVAEAVQAIALLADLHIKMVQYCLFEAEVPALGVLAKSIGFRRETFAALLQLRAHQGPLPAGCVVNAMQRYDSLTKDTARRIIRFLKVRLSAEAS